MTGGWRWEWKVSIRESGEEICDMRKSGYLRRKLVSLMSRHCTAKYVGTAGSGGRIENVVTFVIFNTFITLG